MAIFNRKSKNLLQRAIESDWSDAEDKSELLENLRATSLRSQEALQLIWHQDAGGTFGRSRFICRQGGGRDLAMLLAEQMLGGFPQKKFRHSYFFSNARVLD